MAWAIVFVALIFLASAACIVAGVLLLAGLPWSLIAAGGLLFGAGAYLRRGLSTGG